MNESVVAADGVRAKDNTTTTALKETVENDYDTEPLLVNRDRKPGTRKACLVFITLQLVVALLMCVANLICYFLVPKLQPKPLSSQSPPKAFEFKSTKVHVPGGFRIVGKCDLLSWKKYNETIDLAIFLKHGLHVASQIPRTCGMIKNFRQNELSTFVEKNPSHHKILAVRDQRSWYKSAFNHVCNKKTPAKERWRMDNSVNCSRKGELFRLINLNEQEIFLPGPFVLKENIMHHESVKKIKLMDYTCLPKFINTICEEKMPTFQEMNGIFSNSADGQNYTDFWGMNSYSDFAPFNPFWDVVYDHLPGDGVCCLELPK